MPELLTSETPLTCTFGAAPGLFQALDLPGKPVVMGVFVAATIEEIVPLMNIPTFAMCSSPANPEVIAATAAALGVLTPMPCVPVVATPWTPPSMMMDYAGLPLATIESKCLCTWGGMIAAETAVEMMMTGE